MNRLNPAPSESRAESDFLNLGHISSYQNHDSGSMGNRDVKKAFTIGKVDGDVIADII